MKGLLKTVMDSLKLSGCTNMGEVCDADQQGLHH